MIRKSSFSTRDPEAAHEFFAKAYVDAAWRGPVDRDCFELSNDRLDAGPFQLDGMRMASRVVSTFLPQEIYYVAHVSGGSFRVLQRKGAEEVTTGELALSGMAGVEFTTDADDLRQDIVTITAAAVRDAAGYEPGSRQLPDFLSIHPISRRQVRIWQATKTYLHAVFGEPQAAESPLLVGSANRVLAGLLLETFPTSAPLAVARSESPAARASGTLRRAVAFIESSAHRDIGITDIAGAARASRRAVEHAFRRHLETTPTAYLRGVRLDLAHRELLEATPDDGLTVTEVAYRWGFSSPSRFTAYYRDTYGAHPSQTLKA